MSRASSRHGGGGAGTPTRERGAAFGGIYEGEVEEVEDGGY